jgi:NodT family efflux transporter outer membrane factor (OMF) lipoprotein
MRRLAWLLPALLAACAVGPDYRRPDLHPAASYLPPDSGLAPAPAAGARLADAWWRQFGSAEIDALVDRAIADGPALEAAKARLEAVAAMAEASSGALLPRAELDGSVGRERVNFVTFGMKGISPIFNLYSLGPSISYSLDIFGGARRQIERDLARADGAGNRLGAAYLMVTGNTVVQALTAAAASRAYEDSEAAVTADQEMLALTRRGEAAGVYPHGETTRAEAQLSADRAALPRLRQEREAARNALAVLTGTMPADSRVPALDLARLTLPTGLPLSLPSELLDQRPDILAAEADLHAASAAVGVAIADRLPHLELTAAISRAAISPTVFWRGDATEGNVTAGIAAPLFEGGALEARQDAAEAAYRASLAEYRQTVLAAFAQVADVLQALAGDEEEDKAVSAALAAANSDLAMAKAGAAAGAADRRTLLDATRRAALADADKARMTARRFIHVVQFHLALGGGWRGENHGGLRNASRG